MSRYNAAGRSRGGSLYQWLLFILNATFLVQLAYASSSLAQDDKSVIRTRARHFSDAGSHKILPRALDPTLVSQGKDLINNLINRQYPGPSTWTVVTAITTGNEGWTTVDIGDSSDVISAIAPYLNAKGLSTNPADYSAQNTRNVVLFANAPSTLIPTGAPMKNVFNVPQGTIIVEDILNPNAAPAFIWQQFVKNAETDFGSVEEANSLGVPSPPEDASGYAIPALSKWSDIVFLQLLRSQMPINNMQRIIQYHITNPTTQTQIREALAIIGLTIDDVNISNGGQARSFASDTDAAAALFKTPNGNGGYFLFAQHPTQLGCKVLSSVSVFTAPRNSRDASPVFGEDTSMWYFMDVEFAPCPNS